AAGARSNVTGATASAGAAQATTQAARATAAMNEAAVASAQANVTKAQSALAVAQQTVSRDRSLLAQGYVAQSQFDADNSNLTSAQSAVQSAVVGVRQAQLQAAASASQAAASVDQSAAQTAASGTAQSGAAQQAATAAAAQSAIAIQRENVATAQQNLDRTVVKSPVDGTVISRTATIGQTVAASFQTPTLFSIAQDLGKMEVDLAVGEPDIGAVRQGENVDFSVLAYPNRTFHGIVSQVRKNSVVAQNVVTYTTVVLVDNHDGTLLPGMTANATITTAKAPNALVVPLGALSYAPPNGTVTHRRHRSASTSANAGSSAYAGSSNPAQSNGANAQAAGANSPNAASPWGATNGASTTVPTAGGRSRIYVQRAGKLVRIPVQVVLSNGTQAAVKPLRSATLSAGDAVVVGDSSTAMATSAHGGAAPANPLTGGNNRSAFRGMH
ncbi:MAG: efflux RND transporter periplasmic adaptor subunit, partial [Candidatus Eremiobacteraeota bacterium]|nr:efflux RND transporter periplasmic adaptor subunit [Candidatus Eremiobacteraeota bacterium]